MVLQVGEKQLIYIQIIIVVEDVVNVLEDVEIIIMSCHIQFCKIKGKENMTIM